MRCGLRPAGALAAAAGSPRAVSDGLAALAQPGKGRPVRVVCAWCGSQQPGETESTVATHDICDSCRAVLSAQNDILFDVSDPLEVARCKSC